MINCIKNVLKINKELDISAPYAIYDLRKDPFEKMNLYHRKMIVDEESISSLIKKINERYCEIRMETGLFIKAI